MRREGSPRSLFLTRAALDETAYSAVALNEDFAPLSAEVLDVASSSPCPLVLFENPSISYDPACFDLIIPPFTPPALWMRSIQDTLSESRKLHARSRALRQDSAATRAETEQQQHRLRRLLASPVDLDEIWRMDWNTGLPKAFLRKEDIH